MISKVKINKTTNEILGEKVRIIYNLYCPNDKKRLLELFTNQKKSQISDNYTQSRKRVINRYLSGDNVAKAHIEEEYEYFNISRLFIKDKPLFTKDEFIDSDIETFTNRVQEYIAYEKDLSQKKFDQKYRYIYMYDDEISCYEIDYKLSQLMPNSENSWSIKVLPPAKKKNIQDYQGSITFYQNRISLTLENEFDHVTMLFETSLNPLYKSLLYGMAVGINDKNQKIPIAKKVIFAETKMSADELGKYYLILNETEQLSADENLHTFEGWRLDASYLSRYQKKISNLHSFFSNVKYSPFIQTSLAHHMIFTEFHAFKNMYDKFAQNQDYFLSNRKRVYLEFLRFLKTQQEREACIILPIFSKSDNIFLYESLDKESIKELVINRAKAGVKFNIIFVIKSKRDLDRNDFYSILNELEIANINISFIYKKQIENNTHGSDFFYAQSHSYVIAKEYLVNKKDFTIIQNRQHIKSYVANLKKFITKVLAIKIYNYK